MAEIKRIAVLTSGGDAPGMNAAVRAVTRKASKLGIEAIGVIGGYRGLVYENLVKLSTGSVSNIINRGGTMLYTDRCLEFVTEEGMQKAIDTCKRNNIDAIIAIGGDGTFRGATDLAVRGIPTIGVTGTIDNDITATDYTVGFDTAMNSVLELVDRLRDTCESHGRINVVEVMGRHCGQIALSAGIAAGAVAVVIPEVPFDDNEILERVHTARENGKRGMIIMVSEGVFVKDENGKDVPYAEVITEKIKAAFGYDAKFVRPAHILRGGNPTLRDRLTATRMGWHAMELIAEGKSNLVVIENDGRIETLDIVFALTTDRLYKGTLKEGDLDKFSPEEIKKMEAIAEKRRAEIAEFYQIANDVALFGHSKKD